MKKNVEGILEFEINLTAITEILERIESRLRNIEAHLSSKPLTVEPVPIAPVTVEYGTTPTYYTTEEIADLLGYEKSTVVGWRRSQSGVTSPPFVRMPGRGRPILYPKEQFHQWYEKHAKELKAPQYSKRKKFKKRSERASWVGT
jgi:hypothetical protein